MAKLESVFSPSEPDPALIRSMALARRICLNAVGLISVLSLGLWLLQALGASIPGLSPFFGVDAAFCVLLGAFSLHLCELRKGPRRSTRLLSILLATAVTLLAAAVLLQQHFPLSIGVSISALAGQAARFSLSDPMSSQTAAGFALLGLATICMQLRPWIAGRLADLLLFLLVLLVLIDVSEYLFGLLPMFGVPGSLRTSPLALFCLFLLAGAALLGRAESGVFSILLGRGIGSRIARLFSPILLLLPFLREVTRAHVIEAHRLPANYVTAVLASTAAMLSFGFLLFVAWRINGMELEIHHLSLRDELTGLYNLRGFHLLAEQALMMAQRVHAPFSVLFIDVDNLKRINDQQGHSFGSATLKEAGKLLRSTFRESDVLGRIGGDEFAVAGQFSQAAIAVATERLREAAALQNSRPECRFTLSLSIGHVTSEPHAPEQLDALLANADTAMYEEKRRKKIEPK
jgi:diguanylate cyclase (GGDEF)-like protein